MADKPGEQYNPLFIYGGVGLGKTHLMHAIGHEIREPATRSCESALPVGREVHQRADQRRSATSRMRRVPQQGTATIDVLLIDDIQFIAGKERTQEEFFHTFNALYEAQKQIVLSSRRAAQGDPRRSRSGCAPASSGA